MFGKERKSEYDCKKLYVEFLKKFDVTPTHIYFYEFDPSWFVIVKKDTKIPTLYGSESKIFLVLPGVNVDVSDIGHNVVIELGTGKVYGSFIPVFVEPEFLEIPSVIRGINNMLISGVKSIIRDYYNFKVSKFKLSSFTEKLYKVIDIGIDLSVFCEYLREHSDDPRFSRLSWLFDVVPECKVDNEDDTFVSCGR